MFIYISEIHLDDSGDSQFNLSSQMQRVLPPGNVWIFVFVGMDCCAYEDEHTR